MPDGWTGLRARLARWVRRRRARKMRERAVRYAVNGWPVAPLAIPRHGSCVCRRACVDPHLVGEVVRDAARAEAIWSECPWDIALITEGFEVVDVPPQYGALLNQLLKTTCPTAMAPAQRRWWFFLVPGSIPAEQVAAAGGVLHSGAGGDRGGGVEKVSNWVPAPGTLLEAGGRIRWLVHPHLTGWQPYRRRDPIDLVFL